MKIAKLVAATAVGGLCDTELLGGDTGARVKCRGREVSDSLSPRPDQATAGL